MNKCPYCGSKRLVKVYEAVTYINKRGTLVNHDELGFLNYFCWKCQENIPRLEEV